MQKEFLDSYEGKKNVWHIISDNGNESWCHRDRWVTDDGWCWPTVIKEDGFNCRLKFSTDGYTTEDINNIKEEIENGNIRDQKSFDKWVKSNLDQQGSDNSDSIDAQDRAANADNDRLDLQTPEGESRRGQNNQNSQENFGTGFIRVYNNDGTNGPRYISIN